MLDSLRTKDLFGATLTIPLREYSGLDFSKKCFVFSGQGSLVVNADHLERFPLLRQRFDAADALAAAQNLPAPSLLYTDPSRIHVDQFYLARTLALFTLSVGLFEVMIADGARPSLLTGHSFGEYAALVAAGVIGFEEMFSIIAARERACGQPFVLGGMIAVSGGGDEIRQALPEGSYFPANFNGPTQTVISVPGAQMKSVAHALKKKRIAAKILESVTHPYHSPLMEDARRNFLRELGSLSFSSRAPTIPVLSSVTGKLLSEENFSHEGVTSLLSAQLTTPVDFTSQIRTAAKLGCRNFVELSFSNIGTPWIKDAMKGEDFKITEPKALKIERKAPTKKSFRVSHDSKLVNMLNKVVASVTGYSVEEISLSKNFQEDLSIDSIKKAQIILSFLESSGGDSTRSLQNGVQMNQLRTIEDVLTWYNGTQRMNGVKSKPSFNLHRPVWEEAPAQIDFALPSRPARWLGLSDAIEFDEENDFVFFDDGGDFNFQEWLPKLRSALKRGVEFSSSQTFTLITHDRSSSEVMGLAGFFETFARETGIQFSSTHFSDFSLPRHRAVVERELRTPRRETVRFNEGRREILRYAPLIPAFESPTVRSVAAIGGAGGITFELLGSLAERLDQIFIMGRRPPKDVQDKISALGGKVKYFQGDCSKKEDLANFLSFAGRVDLLIHAGGTEISAPIEEQDEASALKQIAPKLFTTRFLRELAPQHQFKNVACFSSTAVEFGNAGQSVYGFANAAMAHECSLARRDGLNFSILTWPGWDQVGMTARTEIAAQLKLAGHHLLETKRGCALFAEYLRNFPPYAVCMDESLRLEMELEHVSKAARESVFPHSSSLRFPLLLENWNQRDLPGLRDHMIMDQALVPLSLALSMLWHLGAMLEGDSRKFENVEALSFMVLHRMDSPYVLERVDRHLLEIRSNQLHARARLAPLSSTDLNAPAYREPDVFEPIDMFKQSYARFGPRLRLLENVRHSSDDRGYADVVVSKHTLYPECASLNLQLVILESLFQLSGACSEAKIGLESVPISLEKFVVNPAARPTADYKLSAVCRYPSAEMYEADLYAYNSDGEVFVAVHNVRLRLFTKMTDG